MIGGIVEWSSRWRLKLNDDNCIAVRFTRKRNIIHDIIHVGTTVLAWNPYVKHLGLQFDQWLTLREQVEGTKFKFLSDRNVLLPLLVPQKPLSLRAKILLYSSMLRPI